MIIDFDKFLGADWDDTFGDRAFRYDAFISHRRFDGSGLLQAKLAALGLDVWHDGDADIRDRKVEQKVTQAINQSRYVVACVSEGYADSAWCRAEWLPSLDVERFSEGVRVLVTVLTEGAAVPQELAYAPTFEVSDQGVGALADYLRAGNRLPFSPSGLITEEAMLKPEARDELEAVCRHILDGGPKAFGRLETEAEVRLAFAWSVVHSLEPPPDWAVMSRGFSEPFYGLRSMLRAQGGDRFRQYSPVTLRLIERVALWFADSENLDNRANSM
jgi:hypothetical protein